MCDLTRQQQQAEAADCDFTMRGLIVGPPWRDMIPADPFLSARDEDSPF